jgi:hypothetical protein
MKHRSFLSLSALSAVPVVASAADDAPEADWYETVNSDALSFKAVSEDGMLVLQVELFRPPEDEVTEAKDQKGEFRCYQYKGKDMPARFWPGQSLLTRFDLTWDGKTMNIPERFWNVSFSRFPVTKRPHRRSLPLPTDHCSLFTRHFLPHPLDRQQIRNGPQAPTLPAA